MGAVPYILLGWALTVAGAYAAGSLLVSRLGAWWTREESLALRFLAGSAIYSTIVFFLGIGHLYYRATFFVLPGLLLAAAWRTGALRLPAEQLPELPLLWKRMLWVAAPFTLLYLTNAMAPEVSPDGSTYHLGLVAKYYREHAMVPVRTNMYAALSQGIEMLFLAAYAIGRHSAAAMVHFTYLLTLPWLLVCFGRRYGMPGAGVAAALFVYCSPVVGIDGISAYNDVAAACLWFGVFTVLRRLEDANGCPGLQFLAGVLGGAAYAMKYTLAPVLILAACWMVWLYGRRVLLSLVMLAAGAVPFIVPWVVRNTIWWQNPLAPFFNNWFPNPYVQYWFEAEYRRHMAMYSLDSWRQIPFDVTVQGAHLNGILGPLFLLAPLAFLALRTAEGRRVLVAAAFALATYPSNIGTRFLIPALPFVAFAMAMAASSIRWAPVALVAAHAVLCWPNVIPAYANRWAWRLEKVTWKEALRLRSEDNYILSHLPPYAITRKLEDLVPPGRRILGFGQLPEAYTNREFLVGFQSSEGQNLREIYLSAIALERRPTRLVKLRIPAGRRRSVRVVQDKDDATSQWSVTEMRIYDDKREIARSPHWRLRANPAPHEVQRAFDNSTVTRWLTDRGRAAGMFIEVDFGGNEFFDRVEMLITPDQPWDTYHVEVPRDGGGWERVEAKLELAELPAPLGLRRAAVEELLARNIQYLVVVPSDFGYDDLLLNRAVWGIEELANVGEIRLYRLQSREEFEAALKGKKP